MTERAVRLHGLGHRFPTTSWLFHGLDEVLRPGEVIREGQTLIRNAQNAPASGGQPVR